jgi:hypothetical protein
VPLIEGRENYFTSWALGWLAEARRLPDRRGRDRAQRGHDRHHPKHAASSHPAAEPSSRTSGMLGLEDSGDGAAGAEAGRYGGEARHHEDRARHHGEQLPERREGRIRVDCLDQFDASWDAQDGAGERGKHLCR